MFFRTLFTAIITSGLLLPAATASASPWTVKPETSSLTFSAGKGGNAIRGSLGSFSAEVILDPANLANASIRVTIPLNDATTGRADNDKALHGAEWFNTGQFPEAVYESASVARLEDGTYSAEGSLTIKDIALPATLSFTLNVNDSDAHAEGQAQINRKAYGIGFKDGSLVPFDVTVSFSLDASKAD
ncbi:YceI family protein [Coralliovum pocilloporae]|uniref:YceI family protein n=1 Tax=Coralliovum pocilloporae TaxID=3066369 RepID=UPI003307BAE8